MGKSCKKSPVKTAIKCFVGAWGFINSTLVNTTSGDIITQDWAYPVPSGMSLFTPNGYTALLVTANDTTRPDLRPQGLDQSNPSSSPDSEWAKIGKYSVAGAGPFRLSNVTDEKGPEGPEGVQTGTFLTSTIPARLGPYEFTFKFYNDCSAWNLHQDVGLGSRGLRGTTDCLIRMRSKKYTIK
ncbi:hypothetical protein CH063_01542 [Colletotrichum higginsianum]|uniref:Uncharacterized protein n=2 Tax=Colletotrichum higginsianum TaxID=80884 RepID=H1V8U7_COLHI|nr:uncharacterized protein CH63R_09799 [Colletotrichum higginsianum IMI 349063]OBR05679.1 hypothetical protein CH63R_09799 [Colletotrichum higginsianum IMI 349063]TIC90469.1 hypothetical protein CH35J_011839 [Colletotrichum higginsianum]CCF36650.1 hypothetical protein CH063_01542 [Colletotrichum higginsianum]